MLTLMAATKLLLYALKFIAPRPGKIVRFAFKGRCSFFAEKSRLFFVARLNK